MTQTTQIEARFWKALRSDRTVMLGLAGVDEGHGQPMTAQFENDEDHGPLWFFAAGDSDLVQALGESQRGVFDFASKGHDLFAAVHGQLTPHNDRAMIDALWSSSVAAWFPGGKDDPNLQLLRFDAERAQIWLSSSSLMAGVKMRFGADPKADLADKVAKVSLK